MSCRRIDFKGGSAYLCGPDRRGGFGPWSWELHNYCGVAWYWLSGTRFERQLNPGEYSPLWLIFYAQKGDR